MAKAKLPPKLDIRIDPKVFNDKYLPELMSIHEYEVYYGGQGSGKSWFVAQKKALQLTIMEGRNMLCLRKQATDCFDSCWGQMKEAMKQLKLEQFWHVRESDHRMINILNGNQIYFQGVDKIGNIKSFKPDNGNLTDVWYEETDEEEDVGNIRIIDGRIRDENLITSLILSFNPIHRKHWLKKYIEEEITLGDYIVIHSTHWDNKFASKSYHEKTERLRYTDPYRYQVYAQGRWGVTGKTVFNANIINNRLSILMRKHEEKPPERIEFAFERSENGLPLPDSFVPFKYTDGETKIYRHPNPKHPYVLSIDTAGESGEDYYAGQMIDNIDGVQVAVFHSRRDPALCVLQLFGLARYYNDALVVPEINFDGSYVVKTFQSLKYHNIYQRVRPADAYSDGYEQKLGFRTTVETRPRILQELQDWSQEHIDCINDVDTLEEMLTFTRQAKKMKGIWWGAEPGAHDDLVMALAIALQGRDQQECVEIPEKKSLKGTYFPEELDMMLQEKAIRRHDVLEYKKKHKLFGEGYKYKVKKRVYGTGY